MSQMPWPQRQPDPGAYNPPKSGDDLWGQTQPVMMEAPGGKVEFAGMAGVTSWFEPEEHILVTFQTGKQTFTKRVRAVRSWRDYNGDMIHALIESEDH